MISVRASVLVLLSSTILLLGCTPARSSATPAGKQDVGQEPELTSPAGDRQEAAAEEAVESEGPGDEEALCQDPVAEEAFSKGEPIPGTIDQAMNLRLAGRRAEALMMLAWVREDSEEKGDAQEAAWALHRAGDVLVDLREGELAARVYQQALEEHLAAENLPAASRAANDLGLLYGGACLNRGAEEAQSWFRRAVELALEADDFDRARRSANNLGVSLFYSERFEEADEVWREALGYAEQNDDTEGVAQQHTNLALLWALVSEGGFPERGPTAAPPKVDPDSEAERKARRHYAAALEAAAAAGISEEWVCGMFGAYGNRCERLAPTGPEAGLEE